MHVLSENQRPPGYELGYFKFANPLASRDLQAEKQQI
jgi:hypothetical protein